MYEEQSIGKVHCRGHVEEITLHSAARNTPLVVINQTCYEDSNKHLGELEEGDELGN